jgi:hypothetical protein
MYLYVIKLSGISSSKLHYSLRDPGLERWTSEPIFYTVYLSPTGKLCSHKGAAYTDSPELAQALLDHYRSSLDGRGYGSYVATVERILASKYEQRWLLKTKPKILEILSVV